MNPKILQAISILIFLVAVTVLVIGVQQSKPLVDNSSNPAHEVLRVADPIDHASVNLSEESYLAVDLQHSMNSRTPPSLDLKPSMRALAFPVTELTGIGGFLNPGNYVDLVYVSTRVEGVRIVDTQQILRNVRVLSFGEVIDSDSLVQRSASTAVLEVPAANVPDLVRAINQGQVTMALVGSEKDETQHLTSESIIDDTQCLVLVKDDRRNYVARMSCKLVDQDKDRFVRIRD